VTDDTIALKRTIKGAAAFRRRHVKEDGRELFLYGAAPHKSEPIGPSLEGGAGETHLRWHPLRGEWSVYAAARQNRTFKPSAAEDPLAPARRGAPATEIPFSDFEIAIFENRFPSFHAAPLAPAAPPAGVETAPATGRCEVVVYSTEARGSLATVDAARRALLVAAWIDRYEALHAAGAAFVLPFENRGEEVGVTLAHPHGQIYAFPLIPPVIRRAADAFVNGFSLEQALPAWRTDYEIAAEGGVAAFCPPFARFPYEVWIAPYVRRARLADMTNAELSGFATLLGEVTRRYDAFFGRDTAYMLSLHAAPAGFEASHHFTAQFYPMLRAPDKVKYLASVEQATGLFTVDIMPEFAARELRSR
jgi:UDPglucose--hexose-1-phosphate uridylyltransferase